MACVLVLMNTYPLLVSQDLVFRSKQTSLQNSVSVMVYSLSGLDHLTEENVSEAMAVVEETGLSRILVTDSAGRSSTTPGRPTTRWGSTAFIRRSSRP